MTARSFVLCGLIALAQAYTTFQTNCTAPSTLVNFVSSNQTRGTTDILSSCLFTIIACTWTVQHLNIPEQREDRDKGWRGDIKWALYRAWTSTKWMLVTAVAPEILIAKSLGDLVAVKQSFEELSQLAKEDGVPWTRTHSLLANMGGFVIRDNVPNRVGQLKEAKTGPASSAEVVSPEEISHQQELDGTLGLLSMSSNREAQPKSHKKEPRDLEIQPTMPLTDSAYPYHLIASDLISLRKAGILPRLPFITIAELNDKNKSDSLVRFIAIVQIVWMVTQVIVRAARHLAISQLEIAVVAFAICATVIYGLNWEKLKGVQTPYTVLQYWEAMPPRLLQTIGTERKPGIIHDLFLVLTLGASKPHRHEPPGSPISNKFSPDKHKPSSKLTKLDWIQASGLLVSSIVFGAVHLIAWNFVFPTLIERKLWWASSVICTIAPLFTFLSTLIIRNTTEGSFLFTLLFISLFPLGLFYIVSRIFLIIEVFRTLYFLPPSAYITTWAANVPHIA